MKGYTRHMKTTKKSFAAPSAKPVDVEYRLKRVRETLESAMMFLSAIDPAVFPESHAAMQTAILDATVAAAAAKSPQKKPRAQKDVASKEAA